MLNLYHISLTNFLFESRIIKEVNTISSMRIFGKIYVLALHRQGLKRVERLGEDAIVVRMDTSIKKNKTLNKLKFLIYLELIFRVFWLLKRSRNAVVSVHVIDLLPLAFLIKIFKRWRIIYDAHELESHTTENRGRIYMLTLLENLFVPFVNLIIVVNESIKKIYQSRYPRKVVVSIYNAPYMQQVDNTQIIRRVLELDENKIIFLYQGGLVDGRGILPLLEAFSQIEDTSNVLVFMGYGHLKGIVMDYSNRFSNIFLLDAVSPDKLLEYTSSCDYGVSLIENTCLSYYYCLPNKVLEYLMCRKPIIVSNLFEMSALVRCHNVGLIVKDLSQTTILNAVQEIRDFDLAELTDNISRTNQVYCWEAQAHKLKSAYKNLLNLT